MSDIRINRAQGVALEDLDVVVVDDSKPMQTIVRSMLNAARVHRVRTFDNAGDAYRAMLVEPPHILITDWNLPDSDGLSLVRSLRDPRSGPLVAVPAILITGHATRRLVEKAIASGVHFVLAKPLSPSNVLKRIDAVILDNRRFVLEPTRGHYVLQGADELLAGQRQRWRELQEGAQRARQRALEQSAKPVRAGAAPTTEASAATEEKKPHTAAATERAKPARDAADRRRAFGFGTAHVRNDPVETSTGQPPRQAS
ncbi:MAG: response regulator [Siculibacillus sp.]|nr:response regulator [Siculibacillus sp.]